LLTDHLGSIDTISDETGSLATLTRLSYDAFGMRRNLTAAASGVIASVTHKGFTGHEMLDNVELIHMNGRVYDPLTGRFISADPFVQEPLFSQSLNRYSYVANNPLSYVDPSGYSWLSKAWKKVKRFFSSAWDWIRGYAAYQVVRWGVTAVCAYFTGGADGGGAVPPGYPDPARITAL
jgi:RHS repeat-associated protein